MASEDEKKTKEMFEVLSHLQCKCCNWTCPSQRTSNYRWCIECHVFYCSSICQSSDKVAHTDESDGTPSQCTLIKQKMMAWKTKIESMKKEKYLFKKVLVVFFGIGHYASQDDVSAYCKNDMQHFFSIFGEYCLRWHLIYNDGGWLGHAQMIQMLREIQSVLRNEHFDAAISVFSGHGTENSIYTSDNIRVSISGIFESLRANPVCNSVLPLWAILCKCRGGEDTEAKYERGTVSPTLKAKAKIISESKCLVTQSDSIQQEADTINNDSVIKRIQNERAQMQFYNKEDNDKILSSTKMGHKYTASHLVTPYAEDSLLNCLDIVVTQTQTHYGVTDWEAASQTLNKLILEQSQGIYKLNETSCPGTNFSNIFMVRNPGEFKRRVFCFTPIKVNPNEIKLLHPLIQRKYLKEDTRIETEKNIMTFLTEQHLMKEAIMQNVIDRNFVEDESDEIINKINTFIMSLKSDNAKSMSSELKEQEDTEEQQQGAMANEASNAEIQQPDKNYKISKSIKTITKETKQTRSVAITYEDLKKELQTETYLNYCSLNYIIKQQNKGYVSYNMNYAKLLFSKSQVRLEKTHKDEYKDADTRLQKKMDHSENSCRLLMNDYGKAEYGPPRCRRQHCKLTFNSSIQLRRHLLEQLYQVTCFHCSKKFKTVHKLVRHNKQIGHLNRVWGDINKLSDKSHRNKSNNTYDDDNKDDTKQERKDFDENDDAQNNDNNTSTNTDTTSNTNNQCYNAQPNATKNVLKLDVRNNFEDKSSIMSILNILSSIKYDYSGIIPINKQDENLAYESRIDNIHSNESRIDHCVYLMDELIKILFIGLRILKQFNSDSENIATSYMKILYRLYNMTVIHHYDIKNMIDFENNAQVRMLVSDVNIMDGYNETAIFIEHLGALSEVGFLCIFNHKWMHDTSFLYLLDIYKLDMSAEWNGMHNYLLIIMHLLHNVALTLYGVNVIVDGGFGINCKFQSERDMFSKYICRNKRMFVDFVMDFYWEHYNLQKINLMRNINCINAFVFMSNFNEWIYDRDKMNVLLTEVMRDNEINKRLHYSFCDQIVNIDTLICLCKLLGKSEYMDPMEQSCMIINE